MLNRKDEHAKRPKEEIILRFVNNQSKIETIYDIENKKARDTLVDAILEYMKDVNYSKEPTKIGKDWLDCVTETMEIERIATACRAVHYKRWIANGVEALTSQRDPVREMNSGMLRRIAKKSRMVDDRLRGQVLDFGCGVGWLTQVLRRRFHCDAVGVDIDKNAIELGRFFGVKGLVTLDEEEKRIPFIKGQFDAVVMKDVISAPDLEGWDKEEILAETSRVLKNEGLLLLAEGNICGMAATFRPYGFELVIKEPVWSAWVKLEELIGKTERE